MRFIALQMQVALNSRCATPAKQEGLLLKEVDKATLECTRNRGGGALFGVLMALLLAGCFIACLAYNGI